MSQSGKPGCSSDEPLGRFNELVKLIHRVQRERGATTAWLASRGLGSVMPGSCGAGSLVVDLRRRTDSVALIAATRLGADTGGMLRKLRDQADSSCGASPRATAQAPALTPPELARTFYSVHNGYSRLIASLLTRALGDVERSVLPDIAMLKEQYGQQRAFISGVAFLPDESLAAMPARAIGMLLKTVERQNELRGSLRHKVASMAPEVRRAVDEALVLPDEISRIVSAMEDEQFDLLMLRDLIQSCGRDAALCGDVGTNACIQRAWQAWTAYIDRLQAIEEVLVTEVVERRATTARRKQRLLASFAAAAAVGALASTLPLLSPHLASSSSTPLADEPADGGGGEGGEGGEGRLVSLLSLAGARLLPFRVSILQACALLCTLLSLAALASATGVLQGRRRRASAPPEQRTGDAKTAPACPSSPASSEKGMCAALPASICLSSSSSAVGSASNSRKSFSMEALPARHRPVASPPAAAPLRPASFSTIGELRAAAAVVRRPPSREGAGGDGSLSPARPLSREGQRVDSLGVAWPAASSQSQADLLFRMSGLGQVQEFVEGGSLLHALGPKPPSTQPPSRTPDSSSPGPDFNPVAWRRLPESGAAPSPAAASAAAEPPVAAGARHRDISPPSAATSPAAAPLSPASPDSAKSGGAAEPPMTFRTTDNLFATVDDHEASDFVERRVLGQGAFGHAVLWESRRNGLLVVAKKLLIAGTTDFRKLENEVAICASLRHPNIVQYLRTSHNDTYLVLMLEYASGGSVADQLDKHAASTTPFEQGRVCLWLAQLSSAVAYLHSVKVLHRDLSASNVFLSAAGDIKVGDFGLSKTTGVNASRSALATTMCGTPNYCSPELINGEPYGAASDVWAIGLIAYQLFTLRHPFEASSVSQLFRLICAGKVDTAALAAAPFPPELTCIADTRHLLHPNAALRMRLVELLALPALRSASPRQ